MLLFVTVLKIVAIGVLGCLTLWLFVLFVQHQPDEAGGMIYIQFFATPMMGLICAWLSAMAASDYKTDKAINNRDLSH